MKWKNRLQTVLTKNAEPENFKECLKAELRITAESQKSEVSAVIRSGQLRHFPENKANSNDGEKEPALVSAVIRSSELGHSLKNNVETTDFKTDHFHRVINRHIADGVKFEVSADDFQVIDMAQTLKQSDREFLKLNASYILCQLQQSLLVKHLFSHSPERFEDFAFSIYERESLLRMTAKTNFEIYVEAVKQTTKIWFEELLENGQ